MVWFLETFSLKGQKVGRLSKPMGCLGAFSERLELEVCFKLKHKDRVEQRRKHSLGNRPRTEPQELPLLK